IVAGYLLDFILKRNVKEDDDFEIEVDGICNCSRNSFINALYKTAKTIVYILLINVVLGFLIHYVGEDVIKNSLNVHFIIQPILATIIGFIPNCAISILLVQLYMVGGLSFGSMIAGLCSGAGMGLAVLFKNNKNMKENWFIVVYIALIAILSGLLIDFIL
ncbi:MAG: putative manganese transporter, partial [Traorella sp.]